MAGATQTNRAHDAHYHPIKVTEAWEAFTAAMNDRGDGHRRQAGRAERRERQRDDVCSWGTRRFLNDRARTRRAFPRTRPEPIRPGETHQEWTARNQAAELAAKTAPAEEAPEPAE